MVGMQIAGSISAFQRRYPGVQLHIAESGGLTAQQAVLSGALDIALTALPVEPDLPLNTLELMRHPLCVLVSRSAAWHARPHLTLTELAQHPLLILNEEFALNRQLMQAFQREGVTPQIALRSGQWDFLAAMVQAGMGVAVLPEPICQPLAAALEWRIGLIWREGSYLSRSAEAWISCCRTHWPDDAPRLQV